MNESYYDIDKKIKNAAGKQLFPFNENSWVKMEALLDEEDMDFAVINIFNKSAIPFAGSKTKKIIPASALFLLLAFITGLIVIYTSGSTSKDVGVSNGIKFTAGDKTTLASDSKESTGPSRDISLVPGIGKDINISKPGLNKDAGMPTTVSQYAIETIKTETTISKIDTIIIDGIASFPPATNNKQLQLTTDLLVNHSLPEVSRAEIKDSSTPTTVASNEHLKTAIKPIAIPPVKNSNQYRFSKNKLLKNMGFYVAVAPEINGVGLNNAGKITFNYSAGLSYNIGKHLSVHTGFIRADKVYQTDRKGYHPPPGSVLLPLDTLQVSAVCKVLDIPVNLRYHFSSNQKNSFFISMGISSYLMKKEKYDFVYFEQGVYKTRQGNFKNRNNHFASNLNISAGYARRINEKLSLNIEPYLKLPLRGVGMGKVNLTSAGFLFSAGLRPW